jgi:hypothetical protein
MPGRHEAAVRARIWQDLDRTDGDADFLAALAELLAPVREPAARAGPPNLRAECRRLLRRRQRSRRAATWIAWIEQEHCRWRRAHPLAAPRPGPELLALPPVPQLAGRTRWGDRELETVVRYVDAMARRQGALANFVQARLYEYRGIHPTGWVGPDDLP